MSNSTVPFTHSAAGHDGISTDSTGSVIIKPCTQAEIDFYESANSHPDLKAHMPVYIGSLTPGAKPAAQQLGVDADEMEKNLVKPHGNEEWKPSGGAKLDSGLSIVLTNATAGFTHPNVLDLKLGARLWDDDAPMAKRQKLDEVANSSTSGPLGFRIAGMKVWLGDETVVTTGGKADTSSGQSVGGSMTSEVNTQIQGGYKIFDKYYGRTNIQVDNVSQGFEEFLSSAKLSSKQAGSTGIDMKKIILQRLKAEIESIQGVLENAESRMYSASVLMVYEGDPDALNKALSREQTRGATEMTRHEDSDEDEEEDELEDIKVHEVVLIDFAHSHWTPGQGPDENVIHGLRSIDRILSDMVSQSQ